MKVKTSDLTGAALDWAVAKCEGVDYVAAPGVNGIGQEFEATWYSTDWAQGGPIIDAHPLMQFWPWGGTPGDEMQCAAMPTSVAGGVRLKTYFGKTKLIAAMRCRVASKLGDEVDVPDELMT